MRKWLKMAKITIDSKETLAELEVTEEFAKKVQDFIFDECDKRNIPKLPRKRLFKKKTVDALFG